MNYSRGLSLCLALLFLMQHVLTDEALGGSRSHRRKRLASSYEDRESRATFPSAREYRPFSIGTELGFLPGVIFGLGLQAQYTLSSMFQLQSSFAAGKGDARFSSAAQDFVKDEETKAEVKKLSMRVKFYPWRSLYLVSGLSEMWWDYTADVKSENRLTTLHSEVEGTSTTIDFGIGNTWILDNGMYIGGEWINFSVPLASSLSKNSNAAAATDGDLDKYKRDFYKFSADKIENTSGGALLFHIGYCF